MGIRKQIGLFVGGALVVVTATPGCEGADGPGALLLADAATNGDARRDVGRGGPDVALGVNTGIGEAVDGARAPAADAEPPDAPRDRPNRDGREAGRPVDAAAGSRCTAGNTCRANARCQRPCFGDLAYRCSCTEGRYVCTACMPVDGGAGDAAPPGERCVAGAGNQGRRCERSGAVCHFQPDGGGQRLCACADVGPDRHWICQ